MWWLSLVRWILCWGKLIDSVPETVPRDMKNYVGTFGLMLILSCAAFSQSSSCHLRINAVEIVRDNTDASGWRSVSIGEVRATIRSTSSQEAWKSEIFQRTAFFKNVPEGEYKVTLVKDGYGTLNETIEFSCYRINADEIVCEQLELESLKPKPRPPDPTRFTVKGGLRTGTSDYDCRSPLPTPIPKQISGGVLNAKAISLPKPVAPIGFGSVGGSGIVSVMVSIDEEGNVTYVKPISGNPILHPAVVDAALSAKFPRTLLSGIPVKVSGVITYNVVPLRK